MVEKKDLINFEKNIAKLYENGEIKAPVHLVDGNEDILISIFKEHYREGDIIFSTWRSHYHWLLSDRSPEKLKKQILDGYSMSVFDKNFITSSIVGGIAPIAVGVALGLKLNKSKNKVLCFLGDASSGCGIVKESIKYAEGHDLPILFIIENNNRCVRANTKEIWGEKNIKKTIEYKYIPNYPHAGVGRYKMF